MGRLDSPQILQRVSKPKVLFTGMKLRSYPAFAGPTTLGCLVRNDALRQQATEVFSDWVPGHHGLPLSFWIDATVAVTSSISIPAWGAVQIVGG